MHPVAMRTIIASSRSTLISLGGSIPGRTAAPFDPAVANPILDAFSIAMRDVPQPVRATLTRLSLMAELTLWLSHDQSRLDLMDFTCLRDVNLSSVFFFGDWPPGWRRNGLWRLLPASTEKLAVCKTPINLLLC